MTADMRAGPSDILKRAGKTGTKIAGCQEASEVIGLAVFSGLAGFPIEQKFFGAIHNVNTDRDKTADTNELVG
jgi:hypothetical protein